MLLVLKPVLAAFVELNHLLTYFIGEALITAVFQHLLLEIICHQCEWLWCGRCRYLANEVVTKLVLNTWLFQKDGFWSHVKDAIVFLACSKVMLERAVMRLIVINRNLPICYGLIILRSA